MVCPTRLSCAPAPYDTFRTLGAHRMKTRIIGAIVALILAAVGAFVLVTYVRGADARAADGAELADVYIVQEAIPQRHAGRSRRASSSRVDTVPRTKRRRRRGHRSRGARLASSPTPRSSPASSCSRHDSSTRVDLAAAATCRSPPACSSCPSPSPPTEWSAGRSRRRPHRAGRHGRSRRGSAMRRT